MEWRDMGRLLSITAVLLVTAVLLHALGLRQMDKSDSDTAMVIAALGAVLWAIREDHQ